MSSFVVIQCRSHDDVDEAQMYLLAFSHFMTRFVQDKTLSHILEQLCDGNTLDGMSSMKRITNLYSLLQLSELSDEYLSKEMLKAAICAHDSVYVEHKSEIARYVICKALKKCVKNDVKIDPNRSTETVVQHLSHPRFVKNIIWMLTYILNSWNQEDMQTQNAWKHMETVFQTSTQPHSSHLTV